MSSVPQSEGAYADRYQHDPAVAAYNPEFRARALRRQKREAKELEARNVSRAMSSKLTKRKQKKPKAIIVSKRTPCDLNHHVRRFYEIKLSRSRGFDDDVRTRDTVVEEFATICPLTLSEIKSAQRNKVVVKWRYCLFDALSRYTKRSLPEIGKYIGGRDHTTVLHARNKIKKQTDEGVIEQLRSWNELVFRVHKDVVTEEIRQKFRCHDG